MIEIYAIILLIVLAFAVSKIRQQSDEIEFLEIEIKNLRELLNYERPTTKKDMAQNRD